MSREFAAKVDLIHADTYRQWLASGTRRSLRTRESAGIQYVYLCLDGEHVQTRSQPLPDSWSQQAAKRAARRLAGVAGERVPVD